MFSYPDPDYDSEDDWEPPPDSLEDAPDVELSVAESRLPTPRLLALMATKKCDLVGDYGFLKLKEIQPIIDKSMSMGPAPRKNGSIEGWATCIINPVEPTDAPRKLFYPFPRFRLIWKENVERVKLLTHWLTTRARYRNAMQYVKPKDFDQLRKKDILQFLAISPLDGLYGRCEILERVPHERVRVMLIDSGRSFIVAIQTLMVCPAHLFNTPPLSFYCIMADVFVNLLPRQDRNIIDNDFLNILSKYSDNLYVYLKNYNFEAEAVEAHLFIESDGRQINLNKLLQEQYSRLWATDPIPQIQTMYPSASELAKQMHADVETNISRPPEDIGKGVRLFKITHVTSPSQFYLVPVVLDENALPRKLPAWYNFMQEFYNDGTCAEEFRTKTSRVFLNRCYVWYYTKIEKWERVRVVQVDNNGKSCNLFLVDLGIFVEIKNDGLREIDPIFVGPCGLAIRGKLQHIAPVGFEGSTGYRFNSNVIENDVGESECWSQEAIQEMKTLAEDHYFYGVCIQDDCVKSSFITQALADCNKRWRMPDVGHKFPLVLVEVSERLGMSLNSYLCLRDDVVPFGIGGGCIHQLVSATRYNFFDFGIMRTTFKIMDRYTFLDVGEVAPRDNLYQRRVDKQTYLRTLPLFLDESRLVELINESDYLLESEYNIPKVIQDNIGMCRVTHIVSPCCMYIRMDQQAEEFQVFLRYLSIQMANQQIRPFSSLQVGYPIAVKTYYRRESEWQRAIVKQIVSTLGMVKVVLVDYGSEIIVDADLIYTLPIYFQTLPGYCIRVHLDVPQARPDIRRSGKDHWSLEACECLAKYVTSWELGLPVYYAWKTKDSEVLKLDILDQNLTFDSETKKWSVVPFDPKNQSEISSPVPSTSKYAKEVKTSTKPGSSRRTGSVVAKPLKTRWHGRQKYYGTIEEEDEEENPEDLAPVPVIAGILDADIGRALPLLQKSTRLVSQSSAHLFESFPIGLCYESDSKSYDYLFIPAYDMLERYTLRRFDQEYA